MLCVTSKAYFLCQKQLPATIALTEVCTGGPDELDTFNSDMLVGGQFVLLVEPYELLLCLNGLIVAAAMLLYSSF